MPGQFSLSVVLPNFNHAHYIREALHAIVTQSYQPLEVVVIDDASTDDSVEIIESYVHRYPFVRLIRNQKNRGHLPSISDAVKTVRGTHIHLPAADDKIFPGLYEKSMALFEQHPASAICSALGYSIDKDGKQMGLVPAPIIMKVPGYLSPEAALRTLVSDGPWFVGVTTIWRRDCSVQAGTFLPELGNYADPFLSRVLAIKFGACYIPEPLGAWRRMDQGFANSQHASVDRQIDIAVAAGRVLKTEPFVSWLPTWYARRWLREWTFDNVLRVRDQATARLAVLHNNHSSFRLVDRLGWALILCAAKLEWLIGRVHHVLFVRK